LTKGEITKIHGLGMNIVEEIVKGIPQGAPPGSRVSKYLMGQLYMLTLSAGCSKIDEFLANELLPVYGIKLRWEVKLQRRITPKELSQFIELSASKAVRYDEAVRGMISPV